MTRPATTSETKNTPRAAWRVMRNPIDGTALMRMPTSGDHTGSFPAATSTARMPATPRPSMKTVRATPLESRMPIR